MTAETLWRLIEDLECRRVACHLSYQKCWEDLRSLLWHNYQESVGWRDVFQEELGICTT